MPLSPMTNPIHRRSLHDELVERIRTMISEGELSPGEKLPEKALTEKFGVSRTPMREAIKVLATEGYLNLIPHKGAFIAPLTLEGLEEITQILGALEALAGTLACSNISDSEIKMVRNLHNRMVKEYKKGNRKTYSELNLKIHDIFFQTSGNTQLMQLYQSLAGRVRRVRYMANISPERWAKAIEEHEIMIQALEDRDATKLSQVLNNHLLNKFKAVQETFTSDADL